MNNITVALYVCYFAIFGSLIYIAVQGTEEGSVGKPCYDAILKMGEVANDPIARVAAEQDQNQKCENMVKYNVAVSHMVPAPN
jgi:hypothetical protein